MNLIGSSRFLFPIQLTFGPVLTSESTIREASDCLTCRFIKSALDFCHESICVINDRKILQ
ncbi:MAG: hypothetical protein DWI02_13325 [Planctomycetota bacterium]|nr:MAG: hypothetical protein DWI02_13325 [Planctomycetota bacterium]